MARVDASNRARYWHDGELRGLSLLDADFTRHDYAPHRHDALVVAVTEIGGSEFYSRGCTEEARVGGLLVFNPTEPHSGRMGRSKRWRYRALYLTEAAIGRVADGLGLAAWRRTSPTWRWSRPGCPPDGSGAPRRSPRLSRGSPPMRPRS